MHPLLAQVSNCLLPLAQAEEAHRLNPWGWTVMILSIGSVLVLVSYCLVKVFSLPPVEQESLKGPLEIDTKDTDDAD
jgi:hypothetical protein